jgi:hypothetical protein
MDVKRSKLDSAVDKSSVPEDPERPWRIMQQQSVLIQSEAASLARDGGERTVERRRSSSAGPRRTSSMGLQRSSSAGTRNVNVRFLDEMDEARRLQELQRRQQLRRQSDQQLRQNQHHHHHQRQPSQRELQRRALHGEHVDPEEDKYTRWYQTPDAMSLATTSASQRRSSSDEARSPADPSSDHRHRRHDSSNHRRSRDREPARSPTASAFVHPLRDPHAPPPPRLWGRGYSANSGAAAAVAAAAAVGEGSTPAAQAAPAASRPRRAPVPGGAVSPRTTTGPPSLRSGVLGRWRAGGGWGGWGRWASAQQQAPSAGERRVEIRRNPFRERDERAAQLERERREEERWERREREREWDREREWERRARAVLMQGDGEESDGEGRPRSRATSVTQWAGGGGGEGGSRPSTSPAPIDLSGYR